MEFSGGSRLGDGEMMMNKLVMHRFRGIQQGVLENFGQINLLVGPNNSGKTAVLEMLYLLGVSGRVGSLLAENLSSSDIPEESGILEAYVPLPSDFLGYKPLPRLWRRHGKPNSWEAAPGNLTDQGSLIYHLTELPKKHPLRSFRLIPPASERVEEYGGFSREDVGTTALFALQFGDGFPLELLPTSIQNEVVSDTVPTRLAYLWYPPFVYQRVEANNHAPQPPDDYRSLAIWSLSGDLPAPDHILFFDFHTAHDHLQTTFFQFAYQLPDWPEKIASAMASIFPEMENCRVEFVPADAPQAGMAGYIRLPGQRPLPIDAFGDGARHAFKVLAALTALVVVADEARPAIFLWEDPELFLHPTSLQNLLEQTLKLVVDKPVQLFFSTQSIEVVAHLTRLVSKPDLPSLEQLRAFRLGMQDGRLVSSRFLHRNLLSWLEDGMDPRFWGVAATPLEYRLGDLNE